jgi:hypothetical protein
MATNIVIYTAIFGDYDDLREPLVSQSARLVLLTDGNTNSDAWEVMDYKRQFDDPCRDARWVKTHPHILFPDADVTIWIDGSLELKFDFGKANKFLTKSDIAMHLHNKRNCIYKEAEACIEYDKDSPEIIKAQMERYEQEGFPMDYGLVSSGIVIRRNNDEITKLNEMWWSEIENGSKRDQLSFDYCRWKSNIELTGIPGNIYSNLFCHVHRYHKEKKCDVLLVKYCETKRDVKMWNDTLFCIGSEVTIKQWNNDKNNIGLVPARNKLLEESDATYVCLMDLVYT